MATILYQVSLQEAIASTRLQLCAVAITFQDTFSSLSFPETQSSYYFPIAQTTSCQPGGVTQMCARCVNSFESMYNLNSKVIPHTLSSPG